MILLASYPKSGNTWMRALLTSFFRGQETIELTALDGPQLLSNRAVFDEVMGVASAELPHNIVDRLRPDYFRLQAAKAASQQVVKLHDKFERNDLGIPHYPFVDGVRVLYILRNPLNVALSFAQHQGVSVDNRIEEMASDQAYLAGRPGFAYDILRQNLGRWDQHVISWVDQSELPVHVVRYEDLLHDVEGVLAAALTFCGNDPDPVDITKAARAARFKTLHQLENQTGFLEKHPDAGRFFDKGPFRDWQAELSAQQIDRLRSEFGAVMQRFGYP